MNILLFSLTLLTLFLSCKKNSQSSVKGHYENFSTNELGKYKGKLKAIPEYEPSEKVILDVYLLNMLPESDLIPQIISTGIKEILLTHDVGFSETLETGETFSNLRKKLNKADLKKIRLVRRSMEGYGSPWVRDFAPISAINDENKLTLIDMNYYPKDGFIADDSIDQSIAIIHDVSRVSLPIYMEGGNFMINSDGHCFMTKKIVTQNQKRYFNEDKILTEAQISSYFKNYVGCKYAHFFDVMPYEETKHIDIWAKFLTNKIVIVNKLSDEAKNIYKEIPELFEASEKIQKYLDDRADEISKLGFDVKRLPMPALVFGNGKPEHVQVRTYANSLILNKDVIVPQFTKVLEEAHVSSESLEQLAKYEKEVKRVYLNAGLNPRMINADKLHGSYGSFHCLTMQFGQSSNPTPIVAKVPEKLVSTSTSRKFNGNKENLRFEFIQKTNDNYSVVFTGLPIETVKIELYGSDLHSPLETIEVDTKLLTRNDNGTYSEYSPQKSFILKNTQNVYMVFFGEGDLRLFSKDINVNTGEDAYE